LGAHGSKKRLQSLQVHVQPALSKCAISSSMPSIVGANCQDVRLEARGILIDWRDCVGLPTAVVDASSDRTGADLHILPQTHNR
jgi:hypothetical protein